MPTTSQLYETVLQGGIVVSSTLIVVELYSTTEIPFTPDPSKLQITDTDGDGLISRTEFNDATGGGGLGLNGGDTVTLFDGDNLNDNTGTLYSATQYSPGDDLNTLVNALPANFPPVDFNNVSVCLTAGTLVSTRSGEVAVEELHIGDTVCAYDGRNLVIRWIASKTITHAELSANPKLRPVRISAGSLGHGLPKRDLLVSRQHRMLVSSKIVMRMFGVETSLIAAIKLTELPGIFVDTDVESVEYFHLLFDAHEVILAEGAPTESLFTGPEALKAVPPAARQELLALFPELADRDYKAKSATFIPSGKKQKELVSRHLKNSKELIRI